MIYYGHGLDEPVRVLGGEGGFVRVQHLSNGYIEVVPVENLTATGGVFEIARAVVKANEELKSQA